MTNSKTSSRSKADIKAGTSPAVCDLPVRNIPLKIANIRPAVTPCTQGGNIKGRQNAAEWIRSAFHDMITHDSALGTGGLDGSIWFELDRAENGALAFEN
ncbi:unnamed protein product, partial [Clonostachys rosea]